MFLKLILLTFTHAPLSEYGPGKHITYKLSTGEKVVANAYVDYIKCKNVESISTSPTIVYYDGKTYNTCRIKTKENNMVFYDTVMMSCDKLNYKLWNECVRQQ